MSKTGMTINFKYNHNGLRTQKSVTSNNVTTTTNYTYHGKQLTHMTKGSDTLHFFYDSNSRPAFVKFNGTMYRYVHNLQGDIVGILDSNNTLVVEYKYDAWGKPISTTGSMASALGTLNPFRYRRYVYDVETGLYYLRSRYYNAGINRFISSDCIIANSRCGVFEYAKNSPVIFKDSTGLLPEYTDVVVYLDPNGVHWQIEIFDVIISHDTKGYKLYDPKDFSDYATLTFSGVPSDIATKGMDYLLDLMRLSEFKDDYRDTSKSVYEMFNDKGMIGKNYVGAIEYDLFSHPCAAIVDYAFKAMGLTFCFVWGPMYNPNADPTKKASKSNSRYLVSKDYLEKINYDTPKVRHWSEIEPLLKKYGSWLDLS